MNVLTEQGEQKAAELVHHHVGIKKYWFSHHSVFISSFFDSTSLLIPDAEHFIVSLIKKIQPKITDEEMQKQAEVLTHEEGAHARVHESYNAMLMREGYRRGWYVRLNHAVFAFASKHFSDRTNLAISLSLEFFTHIAAIQFLKVLTHADDVDERLKRLWIWHSLEEIHHSHISFDIFLYFHGQYLRRISAFMLVSFFLIPLSHLIHLSLLMQNKGLYNVKVLLRGIRFLFGKDGIYRALIVHWFLFLKPGFHTSQITASADIKKELYHHHIEDELVAYFG